MLKAMLNDDQRQQVVGARVREAIASYAGTQTQLAEACGVTPQALTGWVKGKIGKASAAKLAALTGFDLAYLLAASDAPTARLSTELPPVAAQPARLDPERLALVLSIVDGAISDSRKRVPDLFRARMIARIYDGQHDLTGDTAEAVRALLAGLIETSDST